MLLCLVAATSASSAEGDSAAHEQGRELAQHGFEAYKAGDYSSALESFGKASELYPAGQVLRMLGYAQLALERWVEAAQSLERALGTELKPLPEPDRQDVRANLANALAHVATVAIRSSVDGAQVSIDGGEPESLPLRARRLPAGTHRFVVTAPGRAARRHEQQLAGGSSAALELDPAPLDASSTDEEGMTERSASGASLRIAGGVLGVFGMAVAATGTAVLVDGLGSSASAADRRSAYESRYAGYCPGGDDRVSCLLEAELIERDAARAAVIEQVGIGLLVGGVVLGGAGLTMYLLAPEPAASEAANEAARGAHEPLRCGPFGIAGWACGGAF